MWILLALGLGGLIVLVVANLSSSEKKIEHQIDHVYAVGDPQFRESWAPCSGRRSCRATGSRRCCNGDEIFPAMLAAIGAAKRTITFETFIYWSGAIGKAFADALAERARAGVKVHVMLDWVGTGKMDDSDAGGHGARRRRGRKVPPAPVVQPGPAQQSHPPEAVGRRRHGRFHRRGRHRRQLARRRARIPSTGATPTSGSKVPPSPRCRPPSWTIGSKRAERSCIEEAYFPQLAAAGEHAAQLFKSSASEASESVRLMYLLSITSAEKSVRIASAYFVPDDLSVATLVARATPRSAGRDHRPRPLHGCVRRAEGIPVALGGAAGGRRRDLRVPADDVPQQGDGRGRAMDLGRVHQLRQPVLSVERRGQPQCLRSGVRRGPGRACSRRTRHDRSR